MAPDPSTSIALNNTKKLKRQRDFYSFILYSFILEEYLFFILNILFGFIKMYYS